MFSKSELSSIENELPNENETVLSSRVGLD